MISSSGEAEVGDSGAAMDDGHRLSKSDEILDGDVEMFDAEEGDLLDRNRDTPQTEIVNGSGGDLATEKRGPLSKNQKRRMRKKKNKMKMDDSVPKPVDINRFVLDACRRLKEKKSYLVYTAAGCLGVSALSDLIREVDAIQACGGQMTADGKRYRTGGGILWKVIKARDPAAYREIMQKAKEFEKQFTQRQIPTQNNDYSSGKTILPATEGASSCIQDEKSFGEVKRKPVRERIRVPVSYNDICGVETQAESI